MDSNEKKQVYLKGTLLTPLYLGQSAIISHRGQVIRTSRLVAIHEVSGERICFETMNSYYCVEPQPAPVSVARPMYSLCGIAA